MHFTRWTTTAEMRGGSGAQILDFVTRQLHTPGAGVGEVPWAVLDADSLGKVRMNVSSAADPDARYR